MSGKIVEFKYYMHAGDRLDVEDRFKELARKEHLHLDREALDKLQWSFYEVELTCELDTETMDVRIISAK